MFTIRSGMRAPALGAPTSELCAAAGGPYRTVTVDEAADHMRGGVLPLAPLCGGVPTDVAWPYLERAAQAAARAH